MKQVLCGMVFFMLISWMIALLSLDGGKGVAEHVLRQADPDAVVSVEKTVGMWGWSTRYTYETTKSNILEHAQR